MLIQISHDSDTPIHTQLYDQLVIGIAAGALQPGEELPSVRRLAADIGIHAHTVNKSYAALREAGYLHMTSRSRCRVAAAFPKSADFEENLRVRLRSLAAQAACHGMTAKEFAAFCHAIFEEMRGSP